MGSPERASYLKVDIASSYPMRSNRPDGVTRFIVEGIPYLEQKGCRIRLIGPYIRDEENNAANFTLGRHVRLTHGRTTHESGYSFNKGLARNIILTTRPDLVVVHEPLAGHIAHPLVSGLPRRSDGKPYPAVIDQFHAREEDLDWQVRTALFLLKFARRLKFNKYGIPTGITPGYLRTIFESTDGRIAVSDATATFWRGIYPGEYKVIYNGINTKELTPEGQKIESWLDGKKTILFTGRHDVRKGITNLIEAYMLIRSKRDDVKLKITGDGKMTARLKEMTQRFNLPDVEFLGVVPREELVKAYRTADIYCSPATGGEGFGRVLAEALASGTLTVGTDIDGYREVIWRGHPFARIAAPNDADDLAVKIEELLNLTPEEVIRLGKMAREYALRFDWDYVADQTVRYYEECVERHGRTPRNEWPKKKRIPRSQTVFDASTP